MIRKVWSCLRSRIHLRLSTIATFFLSIIKGKIYWFVRTNFILFFYWGVHWTSTPKMGSFRLNDRRFVESFLSILWKTLILFYFTLICAYASNKAFQILYYLLLTRFYPFRGLIKHRVFPRDTSLAVIIQMRKINACTFF